MGPWELHRGWKYRRYTARTTRYTNSRAEPKMADFRSSAVGEKASIASDITSKSKPNKDNSKKQYKYTNAQQKIDKPAINSLA